MGLIVKRIPGLFAGLLIGSAAQAADFPVKAKAVEHVRICSMYGAHFYYIPGTDACFRLGGYLRAETVSTARISAARTPDHWARKIA